MGFMSQRTIPLAVPCILDLPLLYPHQSQVFQEYNLFMVPIEWRRQAFLFMAVFLQGSSISSKDIMG